ncbi:hypothetical protein [Halobaculum limi]|uniref:hypothetical protein n=1 Tax=Halobaculum limi TaxID=3031916 RepID=UPI002406A543|nr:hypothetical protein [Halobaculum sp. YSMS11]
MHEDIGVILDCAYDRARVFGAGLTEFERPVVNGGAREQPQISLRKRSGDVADPEIIGEPQAKPSSNHEITPPCWSSHITPPVVTQWSIGFVN